MEKKNLAVLAAINSYSPNGESVVIGKDELLGKLPAKLDVTKVRLAIILDALSASELVQIKFEDEARYCICSTAKGRATATGESFAQDATSISSKQTINVKKLFAVCGIAAFIGSLLASGIGLLIYYLAVVK